MITRKKYLNKLIGWRDEQIIKVVTGIRRSGKSTLIAQYGDYLRGQGVEENRLIFVNFEELENEDLLNYRALYDYLTKRLVSGATTYIFLDEVQKVDGFEKVVDSLYIKDGVDVYITGSNSWLLSGELATLLSGRYVEISILPLSFTELCELRGLTDYDRALTEYMDLGGFPYLAAMTNQTREKAEAYIEGIYNTVIVKDIEERQNRQLTTNRRKVTDISLLKGIARFLAGSIGSPISVKSITDYINSTGRKISQNTVDDYLESLTESFIFYAVERFDVVGKQLMKLNRKYYISDLGLRNYILARAGYDLGFSLENIAFLELKRRGYTVNVGKVGVAEVDFVARKGDEIAYYQVTASLLDEKTFEREIAPLRAIKDNYTKIILTADRLTVGTYDGINVKNLTDWLLEDKE